VTLKAVLLISAGIFTAQIAFGLLLARWMGVCAREQERREEWAEEQQHRY